MQESIEKNFTLAEHYLNQEKPEKALDVLDAAPSEIYQESHYFHLRCLGYYQLHFYEQAIECIQEALTIESDEPNYLYLLGLLRFELCQTNLAEQAFLEVLRLEPDHLMAMLGYARLLMSCAHFEEAEKFLKKAAQRAPESQRVKAGLLLYHSILGADKRVLVTGEEILAEDPENRYAHIMLMQYWLERMHLKKARAHAQTALISMRGSEEVADVLRELKFLDHPLMLPVVFLEKLGQVQGWFAAVGIVLLLLKSGFIHAGIAIIGIWVVLILYSWLMPTFLRNALNQRGL